MPDETTLFWFRNKLIKLKVDKKLFKKINERLEKHGLAIESSKGAVIDATVIEAAARPRRTIEISEDREEEQYQSDDDSIVVRKSVTPRY